ncbi:GNAT family N-acetyltransferase [Brenneria corticis]|uniref:GNAT family N-acetyltransferase n=1 Tax=Brenneria corticis TaxID=2173106 RepID=A0A2U1TJS0_9GAMM|nr:GNAT family N-acetyltransferase [Brenneria sp. CFCC 11842]PWC09656.1 GNAT family N-acetyltransferase [Brenneria sp. CFCC 11842]
MNTPLSDVVIRSIRPDDDLAALTRLIHSAYAPHATAGLRYWGTHQTVEDTAERLASGETWLMIQNGEYIGTVTLRPVQPQSPVLLYRQEGVFSLAQFCISPDVKGLGYGRRLHQHVEDYASGCGAKGIALDTAKPAKRLIALYEHWGYRVVAECDWRPYTNYSSVVMYLPLSG